MSTKAKALLQFLDFVHFVQRRNGKPYRQWTISDRLHFHTKYKQKISITKGDTMAKKTGRIVLFLLILTLSLGNFSKASAIGTSYYVSPTGSDSNPGTETQPLRTIGKAIGKLAAGDTLYVRSGIYQEAVWISKSGTATNPIRIMAYPGETSIIDGNNYHLPNTTWDALLRIDGSYIHVSGLEVRYSNWICVSLTGQHSLVSHMNVHHCRENGIIVRGDYGIVEYSRIWQSANRNETPNGNGWASGLSAARHPDYVTLRGNIVYNNWGEGMSTFQANGTVMEDNIVYDNYSANVYISDATNVLLQRNLIYMTPDSVIKRGSRVGIMLGDETYAPPSANITIVNNLVYGANRNFYWWKGVQGGGMKNVLIANNTFANSVNNAGIQIDSGSHQNVRVQNNIVLQDGSLSVAIIGSTSGLLFSNNLWSKNPPVRGSGQNDVVGDPNLVKNGLIAPGQLTANWFDLLPASPARDRAVKLGEVTVDYFQSPRDGYPDMGAIEYGLQTFSDVPVTYWARGWIESLYNSGITSGCSVNPPMFCPEIPVTRAQVAIFIERGLHGSGYIPSVNAPVTFGDTIGHWASDWIQAFVSDGLSTGCGGGNFCPDVPLSRDQMAVFLLRAMYGAGYAPNPASGTMFGDVPATYWAAAWIEQLAKEGITSGCGNNYYCPAATVSRAEMAVFLVKTFDLP